MTPNTAQLQWPGAESARAVKDSLTTAATAAEPPFDPEPDPTMRLPAEWDPAVEPVPASEQAEVSEQAAKCKRLADEALRARGRCAYSRYSEGVDEAMNTRTALHDAIDTLAQTRKDPAVSDQVLREALTNMIAECRTANASAAQKLGGHVIRYSVLDAAIGAVTGERVVSFCGGYPYLFTKSVFTAQALVWTDETGATP